MNSISVREEKTQNMPDWMVFVYFYVDIDVNWYQKIYYVHTWHMETLMHEEVPIRSHSNLRMWCNNSSLTLNNTVPFKTVSACNEGANLMLN